MYKQIALAIPALVFALISCKKKEDPKPPKQKEMAEIFSQLSTTPLYASVDMAIGESFHGPKGSRFIISPNSFQTADGTPVTGKVQLKIKELLSKSDMMFNNAYTMSGNGRLISAGELFVEATQNDKPVFLKPGCTYQVNLPQGIYADSGYHVFDGQFKSASLKTLISNSIDWTISKTPMSHASSRSDTISLVSDRLGWTAASRHFENGDSQKCTIRLAPIDGRGTITRTELYLFCIPKDHKGVWPAGHESSPLYGGYAEVSIPRIPVSFVAFGLVGGQFFGGILDTLPANGQVYTIVMPEVTPSIFKSYVDTL